MNTGLVSADSTNVEPSPSAKLKSGASVRFGSGAGRSAAGESPSEVCSVLGGAAGSVDGVEVVEASDSTVDAVSAEFATSAAPPPHAAATSASPMTRTAVRRGRMESKLGDPGVNP